MLWFMLMKIGRWSEFPIGVTVFQVVWLVQRRPQIDTSGVEVEPSIRLVRVGEPSFKMLRSLLNTQSSISSPLMSGVVLRSQSGECPFRSPNRMVSSEARSKRESKLVNWVLVFGIYTLLIVIHLFLLICTLTGRISNAAFSMEGSCSKRLSFLMNRRSPPPVVWSLSRRMVEYPSMIGVESDGRSFVSWMAAMSIDESINLSRSSNIFGRIPSAFHWSRDN